VPIWKLTKDEKKYSHTTNSPAPHVELLTLPEYLSSSAVFSDVCVVRSLVFCVVFCWSLFVLLSFFLFCHPWYFFLYKIPNYILKLLIFNNEHLKLNITLAYDFWCLYENWALGSARPNAYLCKPYSVLLCTWAAESRYPIGCNWSNRLKAGPSHLWHGYSETINQFPYMKIDKGWKKISPYN
jgi:hypothetical protein